MPRIDLDALHKYCFNNKELIAKSNQVGCFFCVKIYSKEEVQEYVRSHAPTALCRYCGIDALLPDTVPWTYKDLIEMEKYFFGSDEKYLPPAKEWFEEPITIELTEEEATDLARILELPPREIPELKRIFQEHFKKLDK